MNTNTVWALAILQACLVFGAPNVTDYAPSDLANDYSQFSNELILRIAKSSHGNFVVSPLSLAEILNVFRIVALDGTQREISHVLHPSARGRDVHNAVQQFHKELEESAKLIDPIMKSPLGDPDPPGVKPMAGVKLITSVYVNDLFQAKATVKQEFLDLGANVQEVSFSDSANTARYINGLVEKATEGTIKEIVNADTLSTDTVMLGVNVLYFKAQWQTRFIDLSRSQNKFYINDGSSVDTTMMESYTVFYLYEDHEIQIAKISFKNRDFAMTLVMSKSNNSVTPSLSDALELVSKTLRDGHIQIPKFLIESKHNLIPIMKTMGVEKMFSPTSAAFSLSKDSNEPGLHVSHLVQKAFINVTNDGVEASAVTEGGFEPLTISYPVVFNRPFRAYITYQSMPLFAMQVTDPRSSGTELN